MFVCSSHARTQLHRWRCVVQTHRSRTSLTNTTSHPKQLGRLTHYAFDAVLLSAFLAGVKRSTGLTYVPLPFHQSIPSEQHPPTPSIQPHRMSLIKLTKLTHSPSFKPDTLTESKELKSWVEKYLGVGEWVMDQSVAIMGSSSYFERKR